MSIIAGMRMIFMLKALAVALGACVTMAAGASNDDESYIAQPGDTMNGISQRLLHEGETTRVQRALQKHNGLAEPDLIHPGLTIRIPRAWLKSRPSALEVVAVQGDVRSKGQPLALNSRVAAGDDVRTGKDGYATLKLADGSTITLLPSASAGVERAQATPGGTTDTQMRLDAGRVETSVRKPKQGASRFEVRTPMAIAAVRGTKFRVTTDPGKNAATSEVLEGEVGVADTGNLGAENVGAGFGTRVLAGSAPLKPRALLAPPFLWTGLQLVERPDTEIKVNPLRGASSYRLFISSREDFSSVVLEEILEAPVIRLRGLAEGDYFVRLRGIDDIELEGRDATARMRVRIVPPAPVPANPPDRTRMRGASLEFAWSAQAQAAEYVLQIARDPAFRNLFGERAGLREPRHVAADIPPGDYFWRVAYTLPDGKRSPYSPARTFQLRPAPQPPYPAKIEDEAILLSWPAEPGQSFELQFAADPGFTRIVEARRTSTPGASVPRPAQGLYHARVRATDADGTVGPYTQAVRIDVPRKEPKPVCQLQGPGGICAVYAPAKPAE